MLSARVEDVDPRRLKALLVGVAPGRRWRRARPSHDAERDRLSGLKPNAILFDDR
jgi:hypothetical protein